MTAAVLHDLPMPARLAPWPRASRTTLVRCLWLAGLLHLWALLWLGSAPEGTAPPGQGVQGRLNVTLRGPADDGAPSAPPPQTGPAQAAESPPRVGGRVRDTPLPPEAPPGAERLGSLPMVPALPAAPAAPSVAPAAAAPVLPAVAPLPELLPLPAAPPAPPAEGRLEAGALRAVVPTAAVPLAPPMPAALPSLAVPPAPALSPALSPALPPTSPAANAAGPAPAASPQAAPAGAAEAQAGPRVGADLAVPAAAASAPPRLNLELGRLRGGELSRHGTPGVLPVLPRPPETDKLASEIEKAARADCRKAHAQAGLLAVVPLAIDALRQGGCKW